MRPAKASIILLTKNAGVSFRALLEAVFAQEGVDFEVILIDSGSQDETVEIAREFPIRIYQISPEAFGHGKTRNFGASLAKGEYVVYLTQDALPANPYWLQALLENFQATEVAGVFGKQIPKLGTNPMETYLLNQLYPDQRITKSIHSPQPLRLKNIFFSNVNSAIRKTVWQKYPFEENVIMSEDQVWAKGAILAGYTLIYEPQAAVYHSHHYTLTHLFKRNFDSGVSLRGLTVDTLPQIVWDYLGYLFDEAKHVICRSPVWLPQMILYEFVRGLGLFLGNQHRFIPLFLKRRLSLHASYWTSQSN